MSEKTPRFKPDSPDEALFAVEYSCLMYMVKFALTLSIPVMYLAARIKNNRSSKK